MNRRSFLQFLGVAAATTAAGVVSQQTQAKQLTIHSVDPVSGDAVFSGSLTAGGGTFPRHQYDTGTVKTSGARIQTGIIRSNRW